MLDGALVASRDWEQRIETRSPVAAGKVLATLPRGGRADTDTRVASARATFEGPAVNV